ncbi:MAG: GHKL domain-containing protein [Lachnospiraceae bacterium]|nr:GHKL domain-containing protein [Lachnospiraceae bacterium]
MGYIVSNFESFADIYIRCLVTAYIFGMALILGLWLRPFVREHRAAYTAAVFYFFLRFIYYLIPIDSDLLQGISPVIVFISFFIAWLSDKKRNPIQKLFLGILFHVMSFLTYEISVETGLFEREFISGFDWYHTDAGAIAAEFMIWNLIDYTLAGILMFASTRIVHKIYRRKSDELSWKELLILLTPSWAILIVKPIMLAYFRLWMDGIGNGSIKENVPASIYRMGFCILSMMSLVFIIMLYQNIKESKENDFAIQAIENQTEDIRRHMGQIEEMYEKIRAMRHDMGNHIAVTEGLIASGEREALDDYISEWKKSYKESEIPVKTGNPVTDVVISEFAGRFEKEGIFFENSFRYPEGLRINPFDMSIMITNALQNAYEASTVSKEPFIKLTSVLSDNTFIINLKNRTESPVFIDPEEDLPVSLKNEDGHGYGLKNIRMIARKYKGDIDIRQEADKDGCVFILNIMLIG